jgi:hypothetical protein
MSELVRLYMIESTLLSILYALIHRTGVCDYDSSTRAACLVPFTWIQALIPVHLALLASRTSDLPSLWVYIPLSSPQCQEQDFNGSCGRRSRFESEHGYRTLHLRKRHASRTVTHSRFCWNLFLSPADLEALVIDFLVLSTR